MENFFERNPQLLSLYLQSRDPSNVNLGFGKRYDTPTHKGLGFFGQLPNSHGGVSTELSASEGMGVKPFDYPLMNPQMRQSQLANLLGGGEPDEDTYRRARMSAMLRQGMGMSPFAGVGEQSYRMNDLAK